MHQNLAFLKLPDLAKESIYFVSKFNFVRNYRLAFNPHVLMPKFLVWSKPFDKKHVSFFPWITITIFAVQSLPKLHLNLINIGNQTQSSLLLEASTCESTFGPIFFNLFKPFDLKVELDRNVTNIPKNPIKKRVVSLLKLFLFVNTEFALQTNVPIHRLQLMTKRLSDFFSTFC